MKIFIANRSGGTVYFWIGDSLPCSDFFSCDWVTFPLERKALELGKECSDFGSESSGGWRSHPSYLDHYIIAEVSEEALLTCEYEFIREWTIKRLNLV